MSAETAAPRQIACERCGAEFQCGLAGCWCAAEPYGLSFKAIKSGQYRDCLCPACLRAVAAQIPAGPTQV